MNHNHRPGVIVDRPYCRLTEEQIRLVDETSRELLRDPGLLCHNEEAAGVLREAGAEVDRTGKHWSVKLPERLVDQALESAPSQVVLGARDPANRLLLDAEVPRVYFVSGAETNLWMEVDFAEVPEPREGPRLAPRFHGRPGTLRDLRQASHLAEHLEHLDSFIRCVNIQDPEIDEHNKDVNKFFASLDNLTKHVQGGLTSLGALDDVVRMAELIAGGEQELRENPVISFIACLVKSPLQIVDDTTQTLMAIARRRLPVVVSSSPMGGATAPFDEFGMVAQINAEILAGVTLTQLVSPGTPVLYGSVPVRTRLDNLNDMYGAPEFVHYNQDCIQMARHYRLPCYSTAGVGDTKYPGIQATAEKLLTLAQVPLAGAQYVHYAFGLLDRTNIFCPQQAVLDHAHIGMVKRCLTGGSIQPERRGQVLEMIREVMGAAQKIYVYHLPLPTRDDVYVRYPLEDEQGGALRAADEEYRRLLELPRHTLPASLREQVIAQTPGLLPQALG